LAQNFNETLSSSLKAIVCHWICNNSDVSMTSI